MNKMFIIQLQQAALSDIRIKRFGGDKFSLIAKK